MVCAGIFFFFDVSFCLRVPGYYNEARILDPTTFDTVTVLPNIPASVNNFLGGRTYPLEGSAVLLPQKAPYKDPVQVLICGGSNGVGAAGLDNCVHIAPEAPNPKWILERMVSGPACVSLIMKFSAR